MTSIPIHVEVDSVDRMTWTEALSQFEDASIDQTWAFVSAADSKNQVSHLLLKQGDEVVGCCQTRVRHIPIFNLCLAEVRWGPLVCRRGILPDSDVLPRMMRALKEEYGIKRGCFLRISPHVTGEPKDQMKRILDAEGFQEDRSERPYRTLMLNLAPPLDELRSNLLQRWRRHLNKAEKNDLILIEGTNDELFQTFLKLATEMCERKDLPSLASYKHYRCVQQDLPEAHKMNIIVCLHGGSPVAAVIGSVIGTTGIYLLGATGQEGLGLDASYLAHWRLIQWLKGAGARYYDLGAINPQLNPGGYFFKQGIAGKSGWDETFLRIYQAGFTWRGRLTGMVYRCARLLRGPN